MTSIEQPLSDLAATPPNNLEHDTLGAADEADQATVVASPIGPVWISWNPRGITALVPRSVCGDFTALRARHPRAVFEAPSLPDDLDEKVTVALDTGEAREIAVDLTGVTDFQRSVLETCRTIAPGTVRSYGWIADRLDKPGAVRAVGTALGKNPVPLIIPCHRVVRADGSVGSYAFGPVTKHDLLVREGAILP